MIKMKRFLGVLTLVIIGVLVTQAWNTDLQQPTDKLSVQSALAAPSEATIVRLPFVTNLYSLNTIYGIQVESSAPVEAIDLVANAKPGWIRQHAVLWSAIETYPGERNWDAMTEIDKDVIQASNAGIKTIFIVHGTPSWAQTEAGALCSRIQTEDIPAFATFMRDTVARYSKPPFNVQHWEIWNEPDVAYVPEMASAPFGCWGDYDDKYFGGAYYAQVLKAIYPEIKAVDPTAKVIVGGLLLDCDPRGVTSYCDIEDNNERPPKYLEGILLNGGGPYFDGVSYHAYDYYYNSAPVGQYSNNNWGAAWNTTGPVSSLKAQFLREVLSKYGYSDKFLINTEAAVICYDPTAAGCESDSTSRYEQTKAIYTAQVYGLAIKDLLKANIWYSLYGWRSSGLMDYDLTLRPAFTAFETSRALLKDATYKGENVSFPGVRVYEFQRGLHTIWIAWSLDGVTHPISLPSLPTYSYDYMGNPIAASTSIEVTIYPQYFDWYK